MDTKELLKQIFKILDDNLLILGGDTQNQAFLDTIKNRDEEKLTQTLQYVQKADNSIKNRIMNYDKKTFDMKKEFLDDMELRAAKFKLQENRDKENQEKQKDNDEAEGLLDEID